MYMVIIVSNDGWLYLIFEWMCGHVCVRAPVWRAEDNRQSSSTTWIPGIELVVFGGKHLTLLVHALHLKKKKESIAANNL